LFLHNYIIPQKGCILSFSGCSLFFCFFTAPLIISASYTPGNILSNYTQVQT
jgi:hypothetical protein